MDFIDVLKQFSALAEKLMPKIQTEEATKTSLVMPFFQQVFGYDVFNPDEFVPEFTADVGIKKGEKVDYAIFLDGAPVILIEVKWCGAPLDKHDSQLFRYFGTTKVKFGILTNGIVYKFYTDLIDQNKMDLKPFMELNLLDLKETIVSELKQFTKANFNVDEIFSRAAELKYTNEIKSYFTGQLKEPSDDFIKYMLSQNIYDGMKTQAVIDKFRPIVRDALNNLISEMMNERITSALKPEVATKQEAPAQFESSQPTAEETENNRIQTTSEELQAFYIVKAVLSEHLDVSKLTYKDTVYYFAVLLNDMPSRWICRIKLDGGKKYFVIPSNEKNGERVDIEGIDDLFKYKDKLIATAKRYIE